MKGSVIVQQRVRMYLYVALGCLGIAIMLLSAARGETPHSVTRQGVQQQTEGLLKQVRVYVSGGSRADLGQEAVLAKKLSAVLNDDKLQRLTREERRLIYRDVMLGAREMRFHMLAAYPEDQAEARQYGSLGVALFLRASEGGKPNMKSVEQKKRRAELSRAVDIMVREAWLLSRPARDFLFLLATESIPGLGDDLEAYIVQKAHAFYAEAGDLGRREEKGNLLRLKCRLAKTTDERIKLWDGLAEQKAYRLLLRESLRHGGFDQFARYWETFLKNQRLKRAQRRAMNLPQVQRVS